MADHIKRSIRKYLNEGINITKLFEFLNAVTKQISKNVEIVSFCLGGIVQKTLQESLHVLRHHIFKQFPVSSRLCAGF